MSPRDYALTRWCRWCGSPATATGAHHANGDFDPYGVPVSDGEVNEAIFNGGPQYDRESCRRAARFNIAFGKHIGVYKLPEAAELEQLHRKSIRTVVALAEVVRAGNYDTASTPFDERHRTLKRGVA